MWSNEAQSGGGGLGDGGLSRNINTQITVRARQNVCMYSDQACLEQFIKTLVAEKELYKVEIFNLSTFHCTLVGFLNLSEAVKMF